ncbi:hypothetical protein PAXRUDRAFT_17052 [Paxillus rubicundulus Ve08.2h10]|uniref:Uncharacterized protein n=1 Tax=Paxillus rubicundulus Ve08.2h10 TaxID=930991 RepID=A0A0D0D3K2_9AGAM|nr:hypothetical protein PAXRUDRAFT_17052 [Paxillus rubicundulus Ve08.2h10]
MSTEHNLQVRKNVLILTVDNLLSGWPTYLIDFTPEQLGPIKILLCLMKSSKYVWDEDDEDSDKTPVNLNGIPLGPKLKKQDKFVKDLPGDALWPPIWPRSLRAISPNIPTTVASLLTHTRYNPYSLIGHTFLDFPSWFAGILQA